MKKRKKIFYISGIISLLFIAPLFWYFSKADFDKMNLRVIDIGLPAKSKNGEKLPENTQIPISGWNYTLVKVPVNFNNSQERYYISLIRNLKKENKNKTGIKFQFSDENTYKDVVGIINIMAKCNFEQYGVDTETANSIYAVYSKPNLNDTLLSSDTVIINYLNQKEYDFQHSNFWQKLINFSPKESFYLIFGYLILVYCAILKPKLTLNF